MNKIDELTRVMNKLTKWRGVFMGWQLGTRMKGDPEADAVRDHREVTITLRAETSALTGILIKKGIITLDEFYDSLIEEAHLLDKDYESKFPGIKTTENSIEYNIEVASKTMKNWKP